MSVVLICALDPDARMLALIEALAPRRVVVVDDGSAPDARAVFDRAAAMGATVVRHDRNRGKGQALRTGIAQIQAVHPGRDVVTVDCDGQHRPVDVAAVEAALAASSGGAARPIVLGERRFEGQVPVRSRLGNAVSRGLFAVAAGVRVHDTQTGLRGLPAEALDWIGAVPGDRFEHEQRVLLEAARRGVRLEGVPIATVYLDENASSHFRPIADSARVLAPVLAPLARYAALGLACFALDALLVVALTASLGVVAVAAVLARVVSATAHFAIGRRWVFQAPGPLREQLPRYALLAIAMIAAGAPLLQLAVAAGMGLLTAKLLVDAVLMVVGYLVQRFGVFSAAERAIRHRSSAHRNCTETAQARAAGWDHNEMGPQ